MLRSRGLLKKMEELEKQELERLDRKRTSQEAPLDWSLDLDIDLKPLMLPAAPRHYFQQPAFTFDTSRPPPCVPTESIHLPYWGNDTMTESFEKMWVSPPEQIVPRPDPSTNAAPDKPLRALTRSQASYLMPPKPKFTARLRGVENKPANGEQAEEGNSVGRYRGLGSRRHPLPLTPRGMGVQVGGITKRAIESIVPKEGSGRTTNGIAGVGEIFSRKVFIGGLPPDVDEESLKKTFSAYGKVEIDWPHKEESKSSYPPKGYAFVVFEDEMSVRRLLSSCKMLNNKFLHVVSSPTQYNKFVEVKAWRLMEADWMAERVTDGVTLDPRKMIFIGGIPRQATAKEVGERVRELFGGVAYAGVDTDDELKYPKGAGRVIFSSRDSFLLAINARFIWVQGKQVEMKPYVLDDQKCDGCSNDGAGNENRPARKAPFFCPNPACLLYYCRACWMNAHSTPGRDCHKPVVKDKTRRAPAATSCRPTPIARPFATIR